MRMQALAKMEFSKFRESVAGYDFSFTKPPKNSDALQQVCCACATLNGIGIVSCQCAALRCGHSAIFPQNADAPLAPSSLPV